MNGQRFNKNLINFINSLFWVYLFFYFRAECDTISLIKFSISTTEFAVIFQQHRLIILAMNLISLQLNPARRRKIRSHTHTHTHSESDRATDTATDTAQTAPAVRMANKNAYRHLFYLSFIQPFIERHSRRCRVSLCVFGCVRGGTP